MSGWRGHNLTPPRRPGYDIYGNAYHIYKPPPIKKEEAKPVIDDDIPVTLWCEFGGWENGHPFSEKDPDYQVYRQTQKVKVPTGNSYGTTTYQNREKVTDVIVICGKHVQEMTRSFRKDTPEVEPPQVATLQDLEEEDSDYRRGYEARREEEFLGSRAE